MSTTSTSSRSDGPAQAGSVHFIKNEPRASQPTLNGGVWNCFGCGASGGVKRFAELIGEPWADARGESRAAKAQRLRFQARRQAQAILERHAEERDKTLCAEHREAYGEMLGARDLLSLFHRHPGLVAEFPKLVVQTEREYGEALFQCTVLEARLDGEVAA